MKNFLRYAISFLAVIAAVGCDNPAPPPAGSPGKSQPQPPGRSSWGASSAESQDTPPEKPGGTLSQGNSLKGKTFRVLAGESVFIGNSPVNNITFLTDDLAGIVAEDEVILPCPYTIAGEKVRVTIPLGVAKTTLVFIYDLEAQTLRTESGEAFHLKGGEYEIERGRATKIINDARIYEAAVDQWAIENNKTNSDTFQFSNVSDYIKSSHELVKTSGKDIMGNPYVTGAVKDGIKVNPASYEAMSDVTDEEFWGNYAPAK